MSTEPRSYKKSSYSSDSSDCIEVASTLDHLRDSKNPGVELHIPNVAQFLRDVKNS